MQLVDKAAVLKILADLMEQADECEATSDGVPTAQEGLSWAESQVQDLPDLSARENS